jgi:hypothetical protein
MQNKYLKFLVFIIIGLCTITNFAFAQNVLKYEMTTYSGPGTGASTPFFDVSFLGKQYFEISTPNFKNAFQFFFDFMIGISIAVAVVVFMLGALEGILNDTGIADRKKANERMQNAITGLMIVLSTWLIINTINPDLLRLPIFNGLSTENSSAPSNVTAKPF